MKFAQFQDYCAFWVKSLLLLSRVMSSICLEEFLVESPPPPGVIFPPLESASCLIYLYLNVLSIIEEMTTDTDEKAIAKPAHIGSNYNPLEPPSCSITPVASFCTH